MNGVEPRHGEVPAGGPLGEWLAEEADARVAHQEWVVRNVHRLFIALAVVAVAAIGSGALAYWQLTQRADDRDASRQALATGTRAVAFASCLAQNEHRAAERAILSGFARLSPPASRVRREFTVALMALGPLDCAKRASEIPLH